MPAHRKDDPSVDSPLLGTLLQKYFVDHLGAQRRLSVRTIASYRDTFVLLLKYLESQGVRPETVCVGHLDGHTVCAFLDHLEAERGNSARTRNTRLAAIRSFMRYATRANPTLLTSMQSVFAIPSKRFLRREVAHLSRDQMQSLLDVTRDQTRADRRDRVLLMLMYNTGARVSELIGLRVSDVHLDNALSVRFRGKGRKERTVPLWKTTARLLQQWMKEISSAETTPILQNAYGHQISRSGVEQRLRVLVDRASTQEPSLAKAVVSPHVIRHTTAMHLLESGVDLSVIALWLGHESIQTTHQYLRADLAAKKRALSHLEPPSMPRTRTPRAPQPLQFLRGLRLC